MNSTQKPSVLLVDDDQGVLATFRHILNFGGFEVRSALTADEALLTQERAPSDIAIIDIQLDTTTGVELLRRLKKATPLLQVLLITGHPQVETASEAVRLGACDYLSKPILPNDLLQAAHQALANRQLSEQAESHRSDLQAIFSSLSDGILMLDQEGRIQQSNLAYQRICGQLDTGITVEEMNRTLSCDGICRQAIRTSLTTAKAQHHERFRCTRKDRPKQIVTLTTSPIRNLQGACTGVVAVLRDETRIEELEEQLNMRQGFGSLIGASMPMQKIYAQIEALADLPTTVLIQGESGTGKELVAAALHTAGRRRTKPFIKVNCAALVDTLLESELFGHVRGAFTGAVQDRKGRFQQAHGGTIFLDEIGDISPAMQVRLLRVLQEREIERVGDTTPIKVDLRVISATNQNLLEKVRQGSFREDLYYRLNVVQINTPPLRERLEDLPLLTELFLKRFSTLFNRTFNSLSPDFHAALKQHSWPGNIRELEHLLEHACAMSNSSHLTIDLLPPLFSEQITTALPGQMTDTASTTSPRPPVTTIGEALQASNGNKTEAARLLGISRRTFYRWMEQSNVA